MTTAPTRPVLRYFGGKWKLSPWVIKHFPPHRIYVEPFGGAASVLMRKPRTPIEVYNDVDGRLVNVFRVLRDQKQARELERLIRLTPWSREEYELAHQPTEDSVEQARRTLVLSFQAHGSAGMRKGRYSGWRSQDSGANGHAAHAWVTWPETVQQFTSRLAGVVIEQRDAIDIIRQHDAHDTLLFVDPPYVRGTRTSRHGYEHDMTDEEHVTLAGTLHGAVSSVVLAGYPSELYQQLYGDWLCVKLDVSLYMNGVAAPGRQECLWLNERAASQHRRLF